MKIPQKYLNIVGVRHFRFLKQQPRRLIIPVVWYRILLRVDTFDYLFQGSVTLDQLYRSFRTDASDGARVIAAQHDTEINKLQE